MTRSAHSDLQPGRHPHWRIAAQTSAQIVLRVVGFVAQRDLAISSLRLTSHGDEVSIHVAVGELDPSSAEIMAEKMRNIVGVRSVGLFWPDRPCCECG